MNLQGWANGAWADGSWLASAWGEVAPGEDTTPNPFSFPQRNGVEPASVVTSAAATITGINAPSPVTVSGGQYSVNGGAFASSPGTVENGDQVRVRHTASAMYSATVGTTVTIGGVSAIFRSRTKPNPDVAAGFVDYDDFIDFMQ